MAVSLLQCAITIPHYRPTKVGAIRAFLHETQDGWLPAEGQAVDKELYAELYAIIGLRYQTKTKPFAGDNNFYLPDLRDRFFTYSPKYLKGHYIESDDNPLHTHVGTCEPSASHMHFLSLIYTQGNHNGTGSAGLHAYADKDLIDRHDPRQPMVPSGAHEHYTVTKPEGEEEFSPDSYRVKYFIKF